MWSSKSSQETRGPEPERAKVVDLTALVSPSVSYQTPGVLRQQILSIDCATIEFPELKRSRRVYAEHELFIRQR